MSFRINRDEMFHDIAYLFSLRGTCKRLKVGAIAVKDNRIVASGYVGAPAGQPHCLDVGCEIADDHCIRTIHAEANVIAFAAKAGVSLQGATMYCTHEPCIHCAMLIVNAGIDRLVYSKWYGGSAGRLAKWGVKVESTSKETVEADTQS